MKSLLFKVPTDPDLSFSIRRDRMPYLNNRLHYHPEVELIHFKSGKGVQYVGDSVNSFKDSDIVLVGSNLPHFWRFDEQYFESNATLDADVVVAHFCENFWGDRFLNLPENKMIRLTLERAKRGIQLNGALKSEVGHLLEEAHVSEGSRRIILLLEILIAVSNCDQQVLSSVGFNQCCVGLDAEDDRIKKVYDFTLANSKEKISLKKIAEVAHMSENSFCRYFKSRTRKTFMQFLTEVRVGHACKLLIENKMCIKQIYY